MEVQALANTRNPLGLHLVEKEHGSPAAVVELPPVNRASPSRNTKSVKSQELGGKGSARRPAASPPKTGELGCGLRTKQSSSG